MECNNEVETENKKDALAEAAEKKNYEFIADVEKMLNEIPSEEYPNTKIVFIELSGIKSDRKYSISTLDVPQIFCPSDTEFGNEAYEKFSAGLDNFGKKYGLILCQSVKGMTNDDEKEGKEQDEYYISSFSVVFPVPSDMSKDDYCYFAISKGFYAIQLVLDPETGKYIPEYSHCNLMYKKDDGEWAGIIDRIEKPCPCSLIGATEKLLTFLHFGCCDTVCLENPDSDL